MSSGHSALDWGPLADGRVHRLRAGRDFGGDARAVIQQGRAAAAARGKRLLASRDDLGSRAYLWVQFVDGAIGAGDPCPVCGRDDELARTGPSTVRCDACGSVLELVEGYVAAAPAAAASTATIPARDRAFELLVRDLLARDLTLLGADRLWPLWQACRVAVRAEGVIAELGATRRGGGAFLAAAVEALGAPERRVVLVEHTRFVSLPGHAAERAGELARGLRHEPPVELLEGTGDDLRAAVGDEPLAMLHVDLAGGPEFDAVLAWAANALAPGGALLVERLKPPATGLGTPTRHILTTAVMRLLEADRGLVPWVTGETQILLVRAAR